MISLTQTKNKFYNMKKINRTWCLHSFSIVTGRYMADLLRDWIMNTPRGMETTLKTCSMYISYLIYTSNVGQEQPHHQKMDLHFIIRGQKRTMFGK